MEDASDPSHDCSSVTIQTTCCEEGTWVFVTAVRGMTLKDISPVFFQLGINIISFGTEREPGAANGNRSQTPFKGKFLVCDAEGNPLDSTLLSQLVDSIQNALHLRLTKESNIRTCDGAQLKTEDTTNPQQQQAKASTSAIEVSKTTAGCDLVPGPPPHIAASTSAGAAEAAGNQHASEHNTAHEKEAMAVVMHGLESLNLQVRLPKAQHGVDAETGQLSMESSSSQQSKDEDKEEWCWPLTPMCTVERIMNSPVLWVDKDVDLSQAKDMMHQLHISSLLVHTGTQQPGFITKRDFLKVSFSKNLRKTRVRDVMTQPIIYVDLGAPIHEVAQLMEAKSVRRVIVYDRNRLDPVNHLAPYVGIVSDNDIFKRLGQCIGNRLSMDKSSAGDVEARLSAPSVHGVSTVSTLSAASTCSLHHSISSVSEAKTLTTEERYRAAAALWELDFSEVEVIRKIGQGSFGEVQLGNFRGTKVAVKRLLGFEASSEGDEGPSPTMMPVFAQFFEREIEILATIRHPNVVNFIGACHTPPNVCLVTEFCARGSLDHLLHKSGLHLDLVKKVEFAMDIARGMSCLHAQRPIIIHRDLKTANLLVSARFEVKVADFGLSRIKDHAQLINSRAGLEGTVEYCAPEVLRGEPYTEKCDLWSYGVVLWELFNRQRPYADADAPVYILMMNLGSGALTLPSLREEVATSGLVRMVERCLSWQAQERPSFREVLHVLEQEYKIVRGKAAAVPRSDSASSMMVMGANTAGLPRDASANGAMPQHTAPPAVPLPSPHQQQTPQQRRPVAHALHAIVDQVLSGAAPSSPVGAALDRHYQRMSSTESLEHEQRTTPTSRFAKDGSTAHVQPAARAAAGAPAVQDAHQSPRHQQPNQATPGHGHAHHHHHHHHSVGPPAGHAPAHQQQQPPHGGPGRPGTLRHMRKMNRSKSTPLPAHMWFADQMDSYYDESEETSTVGSNDSMGVCDPAGCHVQAEASGGAVDGCWLPSQSLEQHGEVGGFVEGAAGGSSIGDSPHRAGGSAHGAGDFRDGDVSNTPAEPGSKYAPYPSPFSGFTSPFGAFTTPFTDDPLPTQGSSGYLTPLRTISERTEEHASLSPTVLSATMRHASNTLDSSTGTTSYLSGQSSEPPALGSSSLGTAGVAFSDPAPVELPPITGLPDPAPQAPHHAGFTSPFMASAFSPFAALSLQEEPFSSKSSGSQLSSSPKPALSIDVVGSPQKDQKRQSHEQLERNKSMAGPGDLQPGEKGSPVRKSGGGIQTYVMPLVAASPFAAFSATPYPASVMMLAGGDAARHQATESSADLDHAGSNPTSSDAEEQHAAMHSTTWVRV